MALPSGCYEGNNGICLYNQAIGDKNGDYLNVNVDIAVTGMPAGGDDTPDFFGGRMQSLYWKGDMRCWCTHASSNFSTTLTFKISSPKDPGNQTVVVWNNPRVGDPNTCPRASGDSSS